MSETDTTCGCYACIGNKPAHEGTWLTVGMTRMIVCAICGNKRCPHGTDHRLACTGSNDLNQEGSRYQYTPARETGAQTYAFCEPSWAGMRTREHIRIVDGDGLKVGGGIKNRPLCGFDLNFGWDIPGHISLDDVVHGLHAEINPVCGECAAFWSIATGQHIPGLPTPATHDLPETSEEPDDE